MDILIILAITVSVLVIGFSIAIQRRRIAEYHELCRALENYYANQKRESD